MSNSSDNPLWHVVSGENVPPPDWMNAPGWPPTKSYGDCDARIQIDDQLLQIEVNLKPAKRFLLFFFPLFLLALLTAVWLLAESQWRGILMFALTILESLVLLLLLAMINHREKAGPYLVVDLYAKTLELPRLRQKFPLTSIVRFQWIRGRISSSDHNHSVGDDLNVITRIENGELLRYFIMGSPNRKLVEHLAQFCHKPVEKRDLGEGVHVGVDRNSP